MAAQTRLSQQTSDLGSLQELIDLAKNPKSIIEAHETARKQMALTEAEEAKMAEARQFIAKHAELAADLKSREDSLAKASSDHAQNIDDFKMKVQSENYRLNSWESMLKSTSANQDKIGKEQAIAASRLATEKKEMESNSGAVLERIHNDTVANEKAKVANEVEKNRLEALASDLKTRIAKVKLREQAAEM